MVDEGYIRINRIMMSDGRIRDLSATQRWIFVCMLSSANYKKYRGQLRFNSGDKVTIRVIIEHSACSSDAVTKAIKVLKEKGLITMLETFLYIPEYSTFTEPIKNPYPIAEIQQSPNIPGKQSEPEEKQNNYTEKQNTIIPGKQNNFPANEQQNKGEPTANKVLSSKVEEGKKNCSSSASADYIQSLIAKYPENLTSGIERLVDEFESQVGRKFAVQDVRDVDALLAIGYPPSEIRRGITMLSNRKPAEVFKSGMSYMVPAILKGTYKYRNGGDKINREQVKREHAEREQANSEKYRRKLEELEQKYADITDGRKS